MLHVAPLWLSGVWISLIFYVELLTKEAFANVFGLESHWNRGQLFYTFTSFDLVRAQLTLKLFP